MFEFFFAKQYLWPKKRQLSVSLIGLLSIFVISLVVWLLILFISITEGIETAWLNKLTSLNAQVRITPTEAYYNSYYYQVDTLARNANYHLKTIGEKNASPFSDAYDPTVDEELPFYWPSPIKDESGKVKDLVKEAFLALQGVQKKHPSLTFQDYEVTGALARFRLVRPEKIGGREGDSQSFLTQAAYIASLSEKSPQLIKLIEEPKVEDLGHLLYLSRLLNTQEDLEDRPELGGRPHLLEEDSYLQSILQNITLEEVIAESYSFEVSETLIPTGSCFEAFLKTYNGKPSYVLLPVKEMNPSMDENLISGLLEKTEKGIFFKGERQTYQIENIPLFLNEELTFKAKIDRKTAIEAKEISEIILLLSTELQGVPLSGEAPFQHLRISKCKPLTHFSQEPLFAPPWVYFVGDEVRLPEGGIILPMNFRDHHVLLGDRGYFAYGSLTTTSIQEQRLPMRVVGFYDPGVMAVGARFFLGNSDLVHQICLSTQSVSLDPMLTNGIGVWFDKAKQTPEVVREIKSAFQDVGIDAYWQITPFYEYEFAKDLMEQFQSDRYLFLLIGVIILVVACSNIVSLLLLLVNDKKHEIGILLSLGAKKRSIAAIFGLCGISMGALSCLIGITAAYFTLKNIDSLVYLLNLIEGREAFNTAFYGHSLPNKMSSFAAFFVMLIAPILSLIAGLIPALKACRLHPSAILRSES